jgi:DNA-binding MarR family transcriptional regulator
MMGEPRINRPTLGKEEIESLLAQGKVTQIHLHLLRWLIWLPLLSIDELARLMERDYSTVSAHLNHMEALDLIAHVVISESGWPHNHHRYHVTDKGLYVFAVCHTPSLSVPRLVASYPVDRSDLLARLARPEIHLVLSDFVTRLIAEGRLRGYTLTSYRQPWQETFTLGKERHTFVSDAALLLQQPTGTTHAFYIRVDLPEQTFREKLERDFLIRLLDLRLALLLQGDVVPQLLILSRASRFPFWAELLRRSPERQQTALPEGGIADQERLQEGVYSNLWLSLQELVDTDANQLPSSGKMRPLAEFLHTPATPLLVEQFSQYLSFHDAIIHQPSGLPMRTKKALPRYIGSSLGEEASSIKASLLSEQVRATKAERLEVTGLLTLALSSEQKEMLFWLARHPLLSLPDLLSILHHGTDARSIQQHLLALIELELVQTYLWEAGASWRERERYQLTETALRLLAVRHALSPRQYLAPFLREQDKQHISTSTPTVEWVQRGVAALKAQMAHTNGLYRSMTALLELARRTKAYTMLSWKNAAESIRWYRHPLTQKLMFVRPDAELVSVHSSEQTVRNMLVEYDGGTSYRREYEAKFEAYADYQRETRTALPPILAVIPREQIAQIIRESIQEVGASDVHVVIALEADLLHHGISLIHDLPSA